MLLEYDEGRLSEQPRRAIAPIAALTLPEARAAADRLREELLARGEAGPLFGQERGEALAAILAAIEQTFDGQPLYPSVQARAAHLLYFVIKDTLSATATSASARCSFSNTCGATACCCAPMGTPRLADNAMVALALLIAESALAQKDLMIRLTLNLLEDDT
jgi:hypothetical protein